MAAVGETTQLLRKGRQQDPRTHRDLCEHLYFELYRLAERYCLERTQRAHAIATCLIHEAYRYLIEQSDKE